MSATVHYGANVVFVGDSITANAWYSVSGGLVDQINAQIPITTAPRFSTVAGGGVAGRVVSVTGASVTVVPVSTQPKIRTVNSGVAGNQTGDIAGAVATRITNFLPDAVVLH